MEAPSRRLLRSAGMTVIVGTAGWSIPAQDREAFPTEGAALERYAARFGGLEINSSFHRPHRSSTWERWGASVPDGFLFSVKMPKTITHQHKLIGAEALLAAHLQDAALLGRKLAVHLVQLAPSLAFEAAAATAFFKLLTASTPAAVACEPRHPTWFEPEAEAFLKRCRVARVAADPARVPAAGEPGGWRGLSYFRLHGSPAMYRSSYRDGRLEAYARAVASAAKPTWCIFDNTASSQATGDALALMTLLTGTR